MMALPQMKAIVLAAGLGKRMRPLTNDAPKPMIYVGKKRLIDHALDWLAEAGIAEAVVNTHYLAGLLEMHLRARNNPRITLSHEETLLETGGGIYKALPLLGDVFFAVNSDTICLNGNEHALARLHTAWGEGMDALLLVHPVEHAIGYDGQGDFFIRDDGSLRRPQPGERAPYVFTGIQMLHQRIFADAPDGPFSMNLLYNRFMQSDGALPRIKALVHDGKWLHVGEPASIALAEGHL